MDAHVWLADQLYKGLPLVRVEDDKLDKEDVAGEWKILLTLPIGDYVYNHSDDRGYPTYIDKVKKGVTQSRWIDQKLSIDFKLII